MLNPCWFPSWLFFSNSGLVKNSGSVLALSTSKTCTGSFCYKALAKQHQTESTVLLAGAQAVSEIFGSQTYLDKKIPSKEDIDKKACKKSLKDGQVKHLLL